MKAPMITKSQQQHAVEKLEEMLGYLREPDNDDLQHIRDVVVHHYAELRRILQPPKRSPRSPPPPPSAPTVLSDVPLKQAVHNNAPFDE